MTDHFNTIYKYHPVTKVNAEDMTGESNEAKQYAANLMRQGGRLYWQSDTGEIYHRVELANIRFVMEMTGVELTIIEDVPT